MNNNNKKMTVIKKKEKALKAAGMKTAAGNGTKGGKAKSQQRSAARSGEGCGADRAEGEGGRRGSARSPTPKGPPRTLLPPPLPVGKRLGGGEPPARPRHPHTQTPPPPHTERSPPSRPPPPRSPALTDPAPSAFVRAPHKLPSGAEWGGGGAWGGRARRAPGGAEPPEPTPAGRDGAGGVLRCPPLRSHPPERAERGPAAGMRPHRLHLHLHLLSSSSPPLPPHRKKLRRGGRAGAADGFRSGAPWRPERHRHRRRPWSPAAAAGLGWAAPRRGRAERGQPGAGPGPYAPRSAPGLRSARRWWRRRRRGRGGAGRAPAALP